MHSHYEIIIHPDHLPFSVFLHENQGYPLNWHKEIEILFVLKGSIDVKVRNTHHHLGPDDLILINSYEVHELETADDESVILVFQFDPYFYQKYYSNFTDIQFECNTTSVNISTSIYDMIREKLTMMKWLDLNRDNTYQIKILKMSLELIEVLLDYFKKNIIYDRMNNDQIQKRLIRIIEYVSNNYSEKITLSHLAKEEYISVHYLSKFFKNQMGIGFNKYLNTYRLNKSMVDLLNSNKNILDIALDHGFSNAKCYSKTFKETYNTSPSVFRKEYYKLPTTVKTSSATENGLTVLQRYLDRFHTEKVYEIIRKISNLDIDIANKSSDYVKFEKIISFEFVYDGLNSNWQRNLEIIQAEIKFDYIRFNGIFNTGMLFYSKKEDRYNWFNIDNLLDFFLDNNLKPFIQLSYSKNEYTLKNWHLLLEKFLNHCIEKYGFKEVMSWKFELASEDKTYENAIQLYTVTLNKLSKKFKGINFGILFVPANNFEKREYLRNFRDKDLNFMTVELDEDVYYAKKALVDELFENISVNMGLKTYFFKNDNETELYDTCFEAGNMIYNMVHNFKYVETQVSFIDDMKSHKIFHGGLGLLAFNGLKKSIYNAYYLLSKIEGELISRGDYHLVVHSHGKYYILLYYYNDKISQDYNAYKNKHTPASYTIFKNQFDSKIKNHIDINIKLDPSKYLVRTKVLNENYGSVFNTWIDMGSPERLSHEDFSFLKSRESMGISLNHINVKDTLHLETSISQNEVKLIEIEKA